MRTTILRRRITKNERGSAMTEFSVMLGLMVLISIPTLHVLVFGDDPPPAVTAGDEGERERRSFKGLDGRFRLAALAVGGSASTIVIDDTRNHVSRRDDQSGGSGTRN